MKQKLMEILITISAIALILYFTVNYGKKRGIEQEILKNQEQQIETQNEIIKETKEIIKRKAINRAIDTNSNLEWLRSNRCQDCKN